MIMLLLVFVMVNLFYSQLLRICVVIFAVFTDTDTCLQCFDAVGWVAGRASGL